MSTTNETWVKARNFWATMEIGDSVTSINLCKLIGVTDAKDVHRVSSFLSHQLRKGHARKDGTEDRYSRYKKVVDSSLPPLRPNPPPPSDDTFTTVDLGESIVALIEKLKAQIVELKKDLTIEVEQKTELEKHLEKAKERILELNNELASKQGKGSYKLHELQSLYNGLSA